jgi:hypothetical protein
MEEQPKKLGRPPKEIKPTINEPEANTPSISTEQVVITKEEFSKMQSDIALLKSVASRYKLEEQEALAKRDRKELPRGHLKRLDGKLITRWVGMNEPDFKGEQKIIYQGTTPMGEIMIGHYKTIDNEDIVCEAVKFYRSTDLEYFTKLSQDGDTWTIRFDNKELPQDLKINAKFVNP